MRARPSSGSSLSHARLRERSIAFCVPSTCRTSQRSRLSPLPSPASAAMQFWITCGKYSANDLDCAIELLNATALLAGLLSRPKSTPVDPRLRSPFQHPTIRAPLSKFSSDSDADSSASKSAPVFSRSTSNINTLYSDRMSISTALPNPRRWNSGPNRLSSSIEASATLPSSLALRLAASP